MQANLRLNLAQCYKFYQYLMDLGSGMAHMNRVERFFARARCQEVEDAADKARELLDEHRKAAIEAANESRPIPPIPKTSEPKYNDPPFEFALDEADLEYIHRKTRAWYDEDSSSKKGQSPKSTDWRFLLPVMREIDRAWAEVQAQKSKSNGESAKVEEKTKAENATA